MINMFQCLKSCRPAWCIFSFNKFNCHMNSFKYCRRIFLPAPSFSGDVFVTTDKRDKLEIPCTQIKAICLSACCTSEAVSMRNGWQPPTVCGSSERVCVCVCVVFMSKDTCRCVAWTCSTDVFVNNGCGIICLYASSMHAKEKMKMCPCVNVHMCSKAV